MTCTHYPLSWVQDEMFTRMNAHPQCSKSYDLLHVLTFDGGIDAGNFVACIERLANVHEILRCQFQLDGGELFQLARPALGKDWCTVEKIRDIDEFVAACCRGRRDLNAILAGATPLQLRLGLHDDGGVTLALFIHHLAIDTWGYKIFWRDFSNLYRSLQADDSSGALNALPRPESYFEFAQRERAERPEDWRYALEHWRALLRHAEGMPRSEGIDYRTETDTIELGPEEDSRVRHAMRQFRTSRFQILLAATGLASARAFGLRSIAMTTDFANRGEPWKLNVVAPTINTRLTAISDASSSLSDSIVAIRSQWFDGEAFAHIHCHSFGPSATEHAPLAVNVDQEDFRAGPALDEFSWLGHEVPPEQAYWRPISINWITSLSACSARIRWRPSIVDGQTVTELVEQLVAALASLPR